MKKIINQTKKIRHKTKNKNIILLLKNKQKYNSKQTHTKKKKAKRQFSYFQKKASTVALKFPPFATVAREHRKLNEQVHARSVINIVSNLLTIMAFICNGKTVLLMSHNATVRPYRMQQTGVYVPLFYRFIGSSNYRSTVRKNL